MQIKSMKFSMIKIIIIRLKLCLDYILSSFYRCLRERIIEYKSIKLVSDLIFHESIDLYRQNVSIYHLNQSVK